MILLTHEGQWHGGETVIAFGMFDGVHEGHAKLMRTACALALQHKLTSVVYTFSSHPMATYAPKQVPAQLETRSQKIHSIAAMGIDAAVLRPFDVVYAAQTPEAFVRAFADALHPRHVVIGFNYSFGRMGVGKAQDMMTLGKRYGFETHVVDAVVIDDQPVSSTRVRAAIAAGDMELAARLLGRPYALCGVIEHGKQLGRQLDFPTANLCWPTGKAVPPCGVYAAMCTLRGKEYEAVVNIGVHPTVPDGPPTIEANLLDYDGAECYGCHLRVRLYTRLREERCFDSLEALRVEVMRNRVQARAYFVSNPE